MTKPGFHLSRIKSSFDNLLIEEQSEIVEKYNKNRLLDIDEDNEYSCYCGHTIRCDCSNPGISEFKSGLKLNSIKEKLL